MSTRRFAESVDGFNSTLALVAGDLWPKKGRPIAVVEGLNILCLPNLYSFSVGKFMHSYHNKLFPNHFDEHFVPLSSIHYHSTRPATSKNCFYLELTLHQENVLSNLLAQKYGLQYKPVATKGHSGEVPPKFLLCPPKFSCSQKICFKNMMKTKIVPP